MRILFVAESVPGSRSPQRLQALRELGHSVLFVPTTPDDYGRGRGPSFAYRVSYRLRLPFDLAGANAVLRGLDARIFDVALFDNFKSVRHRTLRTLKDRNPEMRLVWFSEDDMLNPRHRTRWLEAAIPLFDLWTTTKSLNVRSEELPRFGARRILFVNNSYDPSLHRPFATASEDRARLGADITFIGTYEAPRAASLLALARAGLACRVWGNGWDRMVGTHPGLVVENRPLYDSNYVRALCASKINLCFLRRFNRDRQTTRSIEIPACGAFMLHERSEEMATLLRPDSETAYFGNDEELIAQCRRWLADETGRAAVAAAGLRRVRELGLTHGEVMTRILDAARKTP